MLSSISLKSGETFSLTATAEDHHKRLDVCITERLPLYSRSFLQELIRKNCVQINGTTVGKSSSRLREKDIVQLIVPAATLPDKTEYIHRSAVTVIFEHEHFIIIDKPAGLIVHPSHTCSTTPTLVDWILEHYKEIRHIGTIDRPGIVHRLDRDTSGLMIVARTNYAHQIFNSLFQQHAIHKTYIALVKGAPSLQGEIHFSIGRHPVHRYKMTALTGSHRCAGTVRAAHTRYRVKTYFSKAALVEIMPVTGRTHQIRVHFAALGNPLLGDILYGEKNSLIARHALHAHKLNFQFQEKQYLFTSDPSEDLVQMIQQLSSVDNDKKI